MIKVIIVEDEQRNREVLQSMFRDYFPDIDVIAACKNVEEGTAAIKLHQPDLVFLDVELEQRSGFDLLQELDKISFDVIFTTGYEKYAVRAIKFSALDFLIKPFSILDLREALIRYREKHNKQHAVQQFETLFHNLRHINADSKKIALPSLNGLIVISVKDVIRCESDINYTTFFLINKNKVTVAKPLKEFEELLSEYNFFRVHNSHLINLHHVQNYTRGEGGTVTMADGSQVDVSRRKKDAFLSRLEEI